MLRFKTINISINTLTLTNTSHLQHYTNYETFDKNDLKVILQ